MTNILKYFPLLHHILNVMICSNMFYLVRGGGRCAEEQSGIEWLALTNQGPAGPATSSLDIVQCCLIILSQNCPTFLRTPIQFLHFYCLYYFLLPSIYNLFGDTDIVLRKGREVYTPLALILSVGYKH